MLRSTGLRRGQPVTSTPLALFLQLISLEVFHAKQVSGCLQPHPPCFFGRQQALRFLPSTRYRPRSPAVLTPSIRVHLCDCLYSVPCTLPVALPYRPPSHDLARKDNDTQSLSRPLSISVGVPRNLRPRLSRIVLARRRAIFGRECT